MNTSKKPLWLTPDISGTGLTTTVINYLSGKTKLLRWNSPLCWTEFIFIWLARGKIFENTNFFKRWMKPLLSMKKNESGQQKMEEIRGVIRKIPNSKSLFRDKLPALYALELCEGFWDFSRVFERLSSREEKRLVLKRIKELSATLNFNEDSLKRYYEMTEGFPFDRDLVYVLTGSLIKSNLKKAYYLAKKIPFSDSQIVALCQNVEENKFVDVDVDDLFRLYTHTGHQKVLDLILKSPPDKWKDARLLEKTVSEIDQSGTERESVKKLLFPIFHLTLMRTNVREFSNRRNIVSYLPAYQEDSRIEEIISEVVKFYEAYEYKLLYDYFLVWYGYAQKEVFIDLYKQSIPLHGYHRFMGAVEVFKLCKDELVIDAVIDIGLPLIVEDGLNEDFSSFMDWLKESKTPWYDRVKKTIIENEYITKWWKKLSGPGDRNFSDFLKVCSHFS